MRLELLASEHKFHAGSSCQKHGAEDDHWIARWQEKLFVVCFQIDYVQMLDVRISNYYQSAILFYRNNMRY